MGWHLAGYFGILKDHRFAHSLEMVPREEVPFPGLVLRASKALNYYGFLEQQAIWWNEDTVGKESKAMLLSFRHAADVWNVYLFLPDPNK